MLVQCAFQSSVFVVAAFGDGDPSMREDRDDRDAYRRGPDCESTEGLKGVV